MRASYWAHKVSGHELGGVVYSVRRSGPAGQLQVSSMIKQGFSPITSFKRLARHWQSIFGHIWSLQLSFFLIFVALGFWSFSSRVRVQRIFFRAFAGKDVMVCTNLASRGLDFSNATGIFGCWQPTFYPFDGMEIQFHGKALGIWLDVLAAIKAGTQPWKKAGYF